MYFGQHVPLRGNGTALCLTDISCLLTGSHKYCKAAYKYNSPKSLNVTVFTTLQQVWFSFVKTHTEIVGHSGYSVIII